MVAAMTTKNLYIITMFAAKVTSGFLKLLGTAFIISTMVFCTDEIDKIDSVLEMAGNNRDEMEKVLQFYSDEKDSLKLKAAQFLIVNMRHKTFIEVTALNEWEKLLAFSRNLVLDKQAPGLIRHKIDSIQKSLGLSHAVRKDIELITAEELIQNIELAFKVWPQDWNRQLDFGEFCNFILPYKSKHEPYDIEFRKQFFDKNISETSYFTSLELAEKFGEFPDSCIYFKLMPFEQGIDDISASLTADCVDQANFGASKGRALGLPLVIDWSIWPNGRGTHFWNSLVYNNDSVLYADKHFFWGKPTDFQTLRKVAKVFRYSFGRTGPGHSDIESIPMPARYLYDPHTEDVTNQYIRTVSFSIPVKLNGLDLRDRIAYLCIFNNNKWRPIAKSTIGPENICDFEDMGPNVLYSIFMGQGKKLVPVSPGFTVDESGKVTMFTPVSDSRESVVLIRKAKATQRVHDFGASLYDTSIELSNDPYFEKTRQVFVYKDTILAPLSNTLNVIGKFRYARIRSEIGRAFELSEIRFRSGSKDLNMNVVLPKNVFNENTSSLNDQDPLSYYTTSYDNLASWIGFDFGKPRLITEVTITPRTDMNYIVPDNLYELLYWDYSWHSLGEKTATENSIQFDSVPRDAILWLRNRTEGVEEDLFYYMNGEQLFWNSGECL